MGVGEREKEEKKEEGGKEGGREMQTYPQDGHERLQLLLSTFISVPL